MTEFTPSSAPSKTRRIARLGGGVLLVYLIVIAILMFWFSREPEPFEPVVHASAQAKNSGQRVVTGYVSVSAAIHLIDGLLDKPGGYLSNDIAPPGLWMDNMPNHEFGQVQQLRDFALALRNDLSRSQTQSEQDKDLQEAQPLLSYANDKWMLSSTESQYSKAREKLAAYRTRLADNRQTDAQFFARADNLVDWLALVEKQLGSLSQRLSASVAQNRENTDLANDRSAVQATPSPALQRVSTPWLEIDDNFYEARGASYALIHLLKAMEHDFASVLDDKNAGPAFRQIIRELEATQDPIWSPMILNGGGFGFFANHSLVMANYISRANSALRDLRTQLSRG